MARKSQRNPLSSDSSPLRSEHLPRSGDAKKSTTACVWRGLMNSAPTKSTVAYFSMEIALDKAIPTYSGGLGVLAGDTLRSAADLSVPIVGVTLLHRKGLLRAAPRHERQSDRAARRMASGRSCSSRSTHARPSSIEGRTVHIRAWKYPVRGVTGHEVPVYLLDTQLPENASGIAR